MTARRAECTRRTKETQISLSLNLDGSGQVQVETGVGFFDHMLTLLGRHALFDLTVRAAGDLEVDAHHTVEDVGLLLGQAVVEALGTKQGIARYGFALVPMDEAAAEVAVDLSGRPHLRYEVDLSAEKVGQFDTCLAEEFFQALANAGLLTLHVVKRAGENPHHVLEAAFKAAGRALRAAVAADPRELEVPSTKGVL